MVVPAYNAADTVEQALESVLAQTEGSWEALVVDDGSTDDTWSVCARLAARETRIRALRHDDGANRGPSASRNLALEHATGAFVAFLDADDVYLPDALATFRAAFIGWPSVNVVYGVAETFGNGPPTRMCRGVPGVSTGLFPQLARFNLLLTCTTAVRREVLPRHPFPVAMRLAEDWACWLELSRRSAFLFLDQVVARRRMHATSAMGRLAGGDGETVIASVQGRHLRSLIRTATPEQRRAIRRGLSFRAAEALREAASRLRRRKFRSAALWLRAARVISGSPAVLLAALAQVGPQQRRIRRGQDPALTLLPPPAAAPER